MENKTLRVAVVGCGYWGPNIVRNFASAAGVEVAWVCDLDERRFSAVRAYRVGRVTTRYEDILEDPSVDAVAIITPVATHRALGEAALRAGKHVWLEKPLATRVEDAEALVSLARELDLRLLVDHTFLYTSAIRKLRDLVVSGELGEVLYFYSVRVNLGLFQTDTNVLWDLGPHDASIARFVLGKLPRQVSAIAVQHVEGAPEDMAYVTLRYDGNLVGHFHESWLSPVKMRTMTFGGTRRMVVYDELGVDEKIKVYDRGIDVRRLDVEERRRALVSYRVGDLYSPRLEAIEALSAATQDFTDAIRRGRAPVSDGALGLEVVRHLAAAERSIARDGAFVDVE